MSGICGFIRLDGTSAALRDLERQMNALRHLGPDRRRACCEGPAGLGHLLMRVTQEDARDAQPLRDGSISLVADLRLDNREALAEQLALPGEMLRDMPDSALLMRAYGAWGEGCVDHLLGDFAFAIWDSRTKKLVLARDHVGQRRIVFHRAPGFFAFATEFKGLWALPDVPRRLLAPLIRARETAPRTDGASISPFEGIEAVRGGIVMTI